MATGTPSEVLTSERMGELYGARVDIHHVDGSPVVVSTAGARD
ncbi:hypothetical protein [Corynebacterium sp. 11A]|nr:hypothetical protein [Corynebacterium sp. 11A]